LKLTCDIYVTIKNIDKIEQYGTITIINCIFTKVFKTFAIIFRRWALI